MAEVSLQIDVGNSSAKWRLVQEANVLARGRLIDEEATSKAAFLGMSPKPTQVLIASVASAARNEQLAALVRSEWAVEPWFAQTQARSGRLVNSYDQPERMGVDRWLAMFAAVHRHPGRVAVIDSGSALTIDFVDAEGRHEGGYIIPGAQLMERALLLDTDRVRFEEDIKYGLRPGRSTAEAVRHGIALAQVGAVQLALHTAGWPSPQVFVCGGGAAYLSDGLDTAVETAPDLVFEGLQGVWSMHNGIAP